MTLHLDDWIIWDFWLAPRQAPADQFHVFFLQAPRSIGDPELRHNLATVGHAVSRDLRSWQYLGTALESGPSGAWDDFTIWTGSIVQHQNQWFMFYTGRNRAEAGRVQHIGLATSDDLASWTRTSNSPVLEADPQLFATDGVNGSTSTDCRDPWVIRHENQWLMFFTASAATGPRGGRGRVGMAVSSDLLHWDQQSTVAGSGEFGEIEVPQVVQVNGHWVMFFCTAQHNQAPRHQGPAWNGTHYYRASAPTGPFKLAPGEPLLADSAGTLYAARYVADPWIAPCLLAWRRWDEPGHFVGDLTDPIAFTATPDGQLSATW